jgi:hypothetical protein
VTAVIGRRKREEQWKIKRLLKKSWTVADTRSTSETKCFVGVVEDCEDSKIKKWNSYISTQVKEWIL